MAALSDQQVADLLPILAERARATSETVDSFRPPRVGIVEEASSRAHQLILGRRGAGKSMLLLKVQARAVESGQPVAYVDLETLRDNPYPDVLISLLIELLDALRAQLEKAPRKWDTFRSRRDLGRQMKRLRRLLKEPQETRTRRSTASSSRNSRRVRLASRIGLIHPPGMAGASAAISSEASDSTSENSEAEFVRTKMQGLQSEAVDFRKSLSTAVRALGGQYAVIVLDDFYFVEREHQPDVLSYLHQVVKNLNIWLKVGSVEHRLLEFIEGDPPLACNSIKMLARWLWIPD